MTMVASDLPKMIEAPGTKGIKGVKVYDQEAMKSRQISVGDTVSANFHNIQFTLCHRGEVIEVRNGDIDPWIIKDWKEDILYYVSEPCTITKIL